MDIEKTMEFILEQQAASAVWQAQTAESLAKFSAVLEEEFVKLATAQRATEESLKAFVDSMKRGGNGSH